MHNAALVGGLVAEASEQRIFPGDSGRPRLDAVAACTALREAAEAANLTNAALLALNREAYRRERQRAEAIHEYKKRGGSALRELYLQEEPHLLAAIRKGHRPEARGVLNRILVAIHYHAGENIGLAKSLFLELVVSMCRAAVEAGGEAESLLGGNYARMADLAQMQTEDELATWLGEMLERIMDAIQYHSSRQGNTQVQAALEYMRANFTRPITRDDVAREANLSPTHFSRLFRRHTGRRFSDVLNQLRINRACELLARTDRDLVVVALECGFNEQSYFQKVFRRYTGMTPGTYRKQHAVAS
jgi:AraC-like DNA-binding protein